VVEEMKVEEEYYMKKIIKSLRKEKNGGKRVEKPMKG
jgi:hypothetical protein